MQECPRPATACYRDGSVENASVTRYRGESIDGKSRLIRAELGFVPWRAVRKMRTSYALDGAHVEIDTHLDEFAYIPTFLEIEAGDVATIHRIAGQLGFSKDDCLPWNMNDLVKKYG